MEQIIDWLAGQQIDLTAFGLRLAAGLAILGIGRWLVGRLTALIVRGLQRARLDSTFTTFLEPVIYFGLLSLVLVAALSQMGVTTTTLTALIASAGLAIGLALQGFLTNVAAGIVILVFRPFRVGDYISAGGREGTVAAVHVIHTVLTTRDNVAVIIPNAKITGDSVINFSAHAARRLDLVVGVAHDADLRRVKTALQTAVTTNSFVLTDPTPVVSVRGFSGNTTSFNVLAFVRIPDYWAAHGALLEEIGQHLAAAGITNAFSQSDEKL